MAHRRLWVVQVLTIAQVCQPATVKALAGGGEGLGEGEGRPEP